MTNLNPKQFPIDDMGDPVRMPARPTFTPDEDLVEAPLPLPPGSLAFVAEHFKPPAGPPVDDHARGVYRRDDGHGWMKTTNYEYKTGEGSGGKYTAHATAQVQHTPPSADYNYTYGRHDQAPDFEEPTPIQARHMARSHSWIPAAQRDSLEAIGRGEPKLFGTHYSPGKSELFSLFATKEAGVHATTLLGVAARQTALEKGRILTPPDDLSRYSSRLVDHLKGKGVVDAAAPTAVTNDYEHYTEPDWSITTAEHRLPDDEVARGRSTIRQVLRQGKPRKPRETYTQERLL